MEETQSPQTTGQPSGNPGPHRVVSGQQNATSACAVQSRAHETNAQGVHQQQPQPQQQQPQQQPQPQPQPQQQQPQQQQPQQQQPQQQQPQQSATPSTQPKTAPNLQQAECNWTQEHYPCLRGWLEEGISGEEIMQRCGIQRRKELLARVQVVSQREKKFFDLQWDAPSFLEEGKRALPPIKVGADGSLRVSKERLTRMGLAFPAEATARLQKTGPHAFKIERLS